MIRKKKLRPGYPRNGYKKTKEQIKHEWRKRCLDHMIQHGVALQDPFETVKHSATESYRMDIIDFSNKKEEAN